MRVATRIGLAHLDGTSDKTILIGAHYDSTNNLGTTTVADDEQGAPGADDNASGVAAVLACLRLLAKVRAHAACTALCLRVFYI